MDLGALGGGGRLARQPQIVFIEKSRTHNCSVKNSNRVACFLLKALEVYQTGCIILYLFLSLFLAATVTRRNYKYITCVLLFELFCFLFYWIPALNRCSVFGPLSHARLLAPPDDAEATLLQRLGARFGRGAGLRPR